MAPATGGVRIGVTQWSLDGEGPETLHRAAALGFRAIHLSSGELDGDQRLDDPRIRARYLRAAQHSGVAISAISPGDLNDLGLTSPAGSSAATRCWDSIRIAIDAAAAMTIPLVFLPSFRAGEIHDERDLLRTAEVLAEACDHARGGPVTIATENTLGAAGNLELLGAAGRPELRILLDTQNPALWGHAVAPMVGLLWPRLADQVHAKDGRGGQMGNASLGDGDSGFLGTAEALRVHGFAGTVIIENDYRGAAAAGAGGDIEVVARTFRP